MQWRSNVVSSDDKQKLLRWRELKKQWHQIMPEMTLADVEQIMDFSFNLDSENKAGRLVYSHHTSDYLPFYIVIDKATGKVIRKGEIRALEEM